MLPLTRRKGERATANHDVAHRMPVPLSAGPVGQRDHGRELLQRAAYRGRGAVQRDFRAAELEPSYSSQLYPAIKRVDRWARWTGPDLQRDLREVRAALGDRLFIPDLRVVLQQSPI
jgi:hypothetical protein